MVPPSSEFKSKDLIAWGWGALLVGFVIPFLASGSPLTGLAVLTGIVLLIVGYRRKRGEG